MAVTKTRDEIFPSTINPLRPGWHFDLIHWSYGSNPAVFDQHRLPKKHPLGIHWHDIYIDECCYPHWRTRHW